MPGDKGFDPDALFHHQTLRRMGGHCLDCGRPSDSRNVDDLGVRVSINVVIAGTESERYPRPAQRPFRPRIEDSIKDLRLIDSAERFAVHGPPERELVSAKQI